MAINILWCLVNGQPVPYLLRYEMSKHIKELEKTGVINKVPFKVTLEQSNLPYKVASSAQQDPLCGWHGDGEQTVLQCLPDNYQIPLIGHVSDKITANLNGTEPTPPPMFPKDDREVQDQLCTVQQVHKKAFGFQEPTILRAHILSRRSLACLLHCLWISIFWTAERSFFRESMFPK